MPELKPSPLVRCPDGPDPLADLLTVVEAANLTGLTTSQIYYHIKQGVLPTRQCGHIHFLSRNLTSILDDPLANVLTVKEAAALTGRTVHGLHYHIQRGILPAWHRAGIFLLPKAEVVRWHAQKLAEKARQQQEEG